jgi:hypothetical protein
MWHFLVCWLAESAIVEGNLDFRHGKMPSSAAEVEERRTLAVRINYGQRECELTWDHYFNCGDMPDGRYYLDVGSRFAHFEGAILEISGNRVSHTIVNPLTRKLRPSSDQLTLVFLGRTQIFEIEPTAIDRVQGMLFSMPALMIVMFGLMFYCKNVISEMDEAQTPAREAVQNQNQPKRVR